MQYPVPAYTTFVIPTGATTGARIVFDGTTGMILVYNSANLLVDTIGGPDGAIFQTSGTNFSVTLRFGGIEFNSPNNVIVGSVSEQSAGDVSIFSGTSNVAFVQCELDVREGTSSATPTGSEPRVVVFDTAATSVASLYASGVVGKADINGNPETWHVPGAIVNWVPGSSAGGGVYQNIQYRKDNQDNVIVQGAIHATAAFAAGNRTILTLPAGWRPAKVFNGCDIFHTNAADAGVVDYIRWNIATNGNFSISSTAAFAINDNLYIYAVIPLGAMP